MSARLTQAELAARVGVSPSTIGYWERRRQPASPDVIKLVHVLGMACEPSSLTCGNSRAKRKLVTVSCRECGNAIAKVRPAAQRNRLVWCLECLAKHPEATLGQRLKSHRLADGMTQRELADNAGVRHSSIAQYEGGKGLPGQGNAAKLISVLGDERAYEERVDELLTVYRSMKSGNLLGCKIKGVRRIVKTLGNFGVLVGDGSILLGCLFIAAAVERPERREDYARVSSQFGYASLDAKELLAATAA